MIALDDQRGNGDGSGWFIRNPVEAVLVEGIVEGKASDSSVKIGYRVGLFPFLNAVFSQLESKLFRSWSPRVRVGGTPGSGGSARLRAPGRLRWWSSIWRRVHRCRHDRSNRTGTWQSPGRLRARSEPGCSNCFYGRETRDKGPRPDPSFVQAWPGRLRYGGRACRGKRPFLPWAESLA